jgi:hypothetical protein
VNRRLILAWLPFAAMLALLTFSGAKADGGEMGLVIQNGDTVTTYCVPFSGDGITGQQALKQVGLNVEAFGGGSGLAVCAIADTGCQDASSFSSCFCQCQGGDCTYWAFFTRSYGKGWVYSVLAFNLLKAKDGDVHGWKWGKGAANSAPAPKDVTFDQICGHAPRGGQVQATLAPTQPPPTQAQTVAPATASGQSTAVTAEPTGSNTSPASTSPTDAPPTVLVTISGAGATATPVTSPATPASSSHDSGSGGGNGGLLAFGAIAVVLVAGIGGALLWRSRNGA